MNKWDERYLSEDFFYGKKPNVFFADYISTLPERGKMLLPAEGEGRNAIFAASEGWQVEAFDSSQVAQQKALAFAKSQALEISYEIDDLDNFAPKPEHYDMIALIFVHMPNKMRKEFHQKMMQSLKKGGILLIESFAREQINNHSGGPQNIEMLHDTEILKNDFAELSIIKLCQEQLSLDEGRHQGKADVLRFIGKK